MVQFIGLDIPAGADVEDPSKDANFRPTPSQSRSIVCRSYSKCLTKRTTVYRFIYIYLDNILRHINGTNMYMQSRNRKWPMK